MSFLNVTWKSIGSIHKGQSTPGCEDSTQDLPRGASPSPTLPKDFDSSKHISCEIPTIFPETPLDHGHAKFLDGTKEDTPLQIVNNPDDNSLTVSGEPFIPPLEIQLRSRQFQIAYISPELHPVSPTLLSESSPDSSDRLLEDFIDTYHKRGGEQGGDDSINFWSHSNLALSITISRILVNTAIDIDEFDLRLHFLEKKPWSITMRVPGRVIKNNTAKEKPPDVSFNIGKDSQYFKILNIPCHRLITSNRVAALCAEGIIGVTLIRSRVSHVLVVARTTANSLMTIPSYGIPLPNLEEAPPPQFPRHLPRLT
ncbi:hypothetical protein BU17DRAFT_65045 [Hysterangium stoloniferum]|nr:hypothetical protein BU17DRAFT_65045 [Hysterangium stoloniferum]